MDYKEHRELVAYIKEQNAKITKFDALEAQIQRTRSYLNDTTKKLVFAAQSVNPIVNYGISDPFDEYVKNSGLSARAMTEFNNYLEKKLKELTEERDKL